MMLNGDLAYRVREYANDNVLNEKCKCEKDEG